MPDPTAESRRIAARRAAERLLEGLRFDVTDPDQQLACVMLGQELLARADGSLDMLYKPEYETLEVQGVNYALDFFSMLGVHGLAVGEVVRIRGRENGTVHLQQVKECVGVCKEAPTTCPHCGEKLVEGA